MVTIVMTLPVAGGVIDRYGVARSLRHRLRRCSRSPTCSAGWRRSMEVVAVSRAILGLGAGFMFAVPLGLFALYVPDDAAAARVRPERRHVGRRRR